MIKTINKIELNNLIEIAIDAFQTSVDRRDALLVLRAHEVISVCSWLERLGVSAYQTCSKRRLEGFELAKKYAELLYSNKSTKILSDDITKQFNTLYKMASTP